MTLVRFPVVLTLLTCIASSVGATDEKDPFPAGALVVVVVANLPPLMIPAETSGHGKPLALHPGKRGKVVSTEPAPTRGVRVRVRWDEQYWQEWTDPGIKGDLDNNRWFMAQSGTWIKLKSFESTLHGDNLKRVQWLPPLRD